MYQRFPRIYEYDLWKSGSRRWRLDRFLGRVRQDLRYAVRCLHKDRRFTLLAVLALAPGIGSATIIFSAVYGVILNTFDYENPDKIVSFAIHAMT